MNNRQWGAVGLIVVASIGLSGCTATPSAQSPTGASAAHSDAPAQSGVPATWQLVDPDSVDPDSRTLEVEVTRLECADGVTGELLAPVITYDADQVTIRIDAEPRAVENANCQSNDAVPVSVALSEPLGERTLIDGACISTEAQGTAECVTSERAVPR